MEEKKTPKETENTFTAMVKASFKGKPKPKTKPKPKKKSKNP